MGGSCSTTGEGASKRRYSREDDPLLMGVGERDLNDPDLDEFIDLPAELPPPPDGGWGEWGGGIEEEERGRGAYEVKRRWGGEGLERCKCK